VRRLTLDEWGWILAGVLPIAGFVMYAWIAGLLGLYFYVLVGQAATFYSMVWWFSTHRVGNFWYRLSLPFYSFGWILTVVILSFPPVLAISLPALVAALLTGAIGVIYIAQYDFPRMKVIGRADKLCGLGILLSSGGWFFLVGVAYVSSMRFVEVLQEFSIVSLSARFCVILGVIMVTIAVSMGRRA